MKDPIYIGTATSAARRPAWQWPFAALALAHCFIHFLYTYEANWLVSAPPYKIAATPSPRGPPPGWLAGWLPLRDCASRQCPPPAVRFLRAPRLSAAHSATSHMLLCALAALALLSRPPAASGSAAASSSPSGSPYIEHAGYFCQGNQAHQGAAGNHTFAQTAEALPACATHCLATACSCFDAKPRICRLTNWSTAVQKSSDGFTAYVDGRKPHHTPSPRPPHGGGAPIGRSGAARYGCTGKHRTQPFCDTTLTTAERVAKLVAQLTPEEKGLLMTARTTDWSNAIPRLGVPLFCWGQNSAQGYLQTGLPASGNGITTFPRAPGMAATWNMSAVRGVLSLRRDVFVG
eukprot:COSAG01_NODE_507_length_16108_cov_18.603973_4_plen_347_part_00